MPTKHRVVLELCSTSAPVVGIVVEDYLYPGRYIVSVKLAKHLVFDYAANTTEETAIGILTFHTNRWSNIAREVMNCTKDY